MYASFHQLRFRCYVSEPRWVQSRERRPRGGFLRGKIRFRVFDDSSFKLQTAMSSFPCDDSAHLIQRWEFALKASQQVWSIGWHEFPCRNAGHPPVCSAVDGSLGNTHYCDHHAPTAGYPSSCHHHDPPSHLLSWPGAYIVPPWGLQCESPASLRSGGRQVRS